MELVHHFSEICCLLYMRTSLYTSCEPDVTCARVFFITDSVVHCFFTQPPSPIIIVQP